MEAFSDGVFAIATTLLILEIKVPTLDTGGSLAAALVAHWPSYVAFVISFMSIGIVWTNHHTVMDQVRISDRGFQLVTVLLLLMVSFVPFPTAVLALVSVFASIVGFALLAVYWSTAGWRSSVRREA